MAYVNRPVERQGYFFGHSERHPEIFIAGPRRRKLYSGGFLPSPAFGCPQRARAVAACLDETQKVSMSDIVAFNGKRRNVHDTLTGFVVPSESAADLAIHAESGFPRRDFDEIGL